MVKLVKSNLFRALFHELFVRGILLPYKNTKGNPVPNLKTKIGQTSWRTQEKENRN